MFVTMILVFVIHVYTNIYSIKKHYEEGQTDTSVATTVQLTWLHALYTRPIKFILNKQKAFYTKLCIFIPINPNGTEQNNIMFTIYTMWFFLLDFLFSFTQLFGFVSFLF